MIRNIAIRNSGMQPNMGTIDRCSRFLIGLLLLGATLTGFAPSIGAILAIPMILMALIAWDPIYNIIHFNTIASQKVSRSENLEISHNKRNHRKEDRINIKQKGNAELLNKVA